MKKLLRDLLDMQAPLFEKGGKLEKLYPLYEANDTIFFTPGEVTKADAHVRDGMLVFGVFAMNIENARQQVRLALRSNSGHD